MLRAALALVKRIPKYVTGDIRNTSMEISEVNPVMQRVKCLPPNRRCIGELTFWRCVWKHSKRLTSGRMYASPSWTRPLECTVARHCWNTKQCGGVESKQKFVFQRKSKINSNVITPFLGSTHHCFNG